MSKRILCKFFIHGACLKGEYCEFSHDWQDQPNNICTFYQKGVCSYGSRCRYDHVKVSHHQTSGPSPSNSHPHVTSDSHQATRPSVVSLTREYNPKISTSIDVTSMSPLHTFCCTSAWTKKIEADTSLNNESGPCPPDVRPADLPICSFAAAGVCPRGEMCPHIHGNLCSICGKHCLHPFRSNEREDHIKMCHKNNMHLEALKCSQEIECSVCLERVLSKPTAAERKFGVLSECDHPFCISCIRNWRSNSPASGMDVNSALRACPICRQLSYFVIPSVIWYSTKEEKQAIIDSYKTKLKSIDCKYFDFGNGTCPFGTSCFYKHAYRDGRLEEVRLRHLDAEDGNTVIAKDIRLSDFLSGLYL
ncbi:unnamed protein product [Musa acuminata subsp. burmannicoides]